MRGGGLRSGEYHILSLDDGPRLISALPLVIGATPVCKLTEPVEGTSVSTGWLLYLQRFLNKIFQILRGYQIGKVGCYRRYGWTAAESAGENSRYGSGVGGELPHLVIS